MANPLDFTGNVPRFTYQRLVQVSGSTLYDTLGNFVYDTRTSGATGNLFSLQTITDDGNLPSINMITLCDASSNPILVTLPDATNNSKLIHHVKKIDSSVNTVTINTVNDQKIDGGSTAVIKVQYASVEIVCNGSDWFVI